MNSASPTELVVDLPDGQLRGGHWVGGKATVLALHGITANHLSWAMVARQLPETTILAPDLRGRGRSASLPGPYGFAAHVSDLAALLDASESERVVVVGHSMGGFVAVALAAAHPERVSALVLVDGGLPTGRPGDPPPPGGIDAVLGPAAARLSMTFPSRYAYYNYWRAHPAVGPIWGPEVEAYIDYDLVGESPELRSSCRLEAMRVDGAEVADHGAAGEALGHVTAPISFLRAERGLLDEPVPFYSVEAAARWSHARPSMQTRTLADTNHYSLLMGVRGASEVARVVNQRLREC